MTTGFKSTSTSIQPAVSVPVSAAGRLMKFMKLAGPVARKFLTKSVVPHGHGGRRAPVSRVFNTNPMSSQAMELYSTILPKEGVKVLESVHNSFTPEQMLALFSTFLMLKHQRDILEKDRLLELANFKVQACEQRHLLETTTTEYLRVTNRLHSRGLIEYVQNKLVRSYAINTKVQGQGGRRKQIWVAILKADMKGPTSLVHECLCEKLQITNPEDMAGKIVDYYQKMSQYLHDTGSDFGKGLEQLPEELNSDQRSILECFSTTVGAVVKWKKSGHSRTSAFEPEAEDEASSGGA